MQYSYRKEMFAGRAKPNWTIGDPDNQRPAKRCSTVIPKQCPVLTDDPSPEAA